MVRKKRTLQERRKSRTRHTSKFHRRRRKQTFAIHMEKFDQATIGDFIDMAQDKRAERKARHKQYQAT